MKKIIIILFITVVISCFINESEHILIPDDAIRFRIIGNSNELVDQELKIKIKNEVEQELYSFIDSSKTKEEVKIAINDNLDKIDNILKKYNVKYDISFGNNYFPEKTYKGITYNAGNYESLVITLGSGLGKNWWCVLFPPLCLLDEKENLDNATYELYAKKLINNFR